eukprot:5615056-Karenia_brevis.AAC.1
MSNESDGVETNVVSMDGSFDGDEYQCHLRRLLAVCGLVMFYLPRFDQNSLLYACVLDFAAGDIPRRDDSLSRKIFVKIRDHHPSVSGIPKSTRNAVDYVF